MSYAWGLPDLVDPEIAAKLTNKPFTPAWPACIDQNRSVMQQVIEHDKLVSYPYQSMDPFINLLREAAADPAVLSIKILSLIHISFGMLLIIEPYTRLL